MKKNQLIFQVIETLEPFKNEIDLPNFLEGLFDETVPPDRFMSIWLEVTSDYLQDFFHIQEKIRGCFETYKAILKLETKQKVEPLFIPVQFVSVWNFGEYSFSTEAKFDKINNIVFDIEQVDTDNLDLKQLDKEYILFLDGKKFDIERTIGEKQEMIQLKNYQMESEA